MTAYEVVLDASLLVAGIRRGDPGHVPARSVLTWLTANDATLHVPAIALSEVSAAIARGTDNTELALRDVALLQQLPGFALRPVDVALAQSSARVAAENRIRGCDAVYVALARQLDAPLITLDRQQRERAPDDVVVRMPEAYLGE